MADAETIKSVIREMLTSKFKGILVNSVEVEEDPDDDTVFRVSVVYEATDNALDAKSVVGFLRSLRPALSERDEDRFPVMSFVTQYDKEHLAGAA